MTVQKKRKAVAIWLLIGVFMIIIEVFVGGTTRLTGSGLSITEWKPIMGAVPPLNDAEWETAFSQYQQIAQYKYLNSHFTMDDFKFIFFWEWFHRLWARLLGVVFLCGFVFFIVRRYFDREMVLPLIFLFFLGAMQGLIGWVMVQSGLNDTDLYVSHIRLAIHFIAALVLLCYTLWFALRLLIPENIKKYSPAMQKRTGVLLAVLLVQLIYGAFMSGLKAAPSAPTWPTINGSWVPESFPGKSWIHEVLNVQFIHRTLAYILCLLVLSWWLSARRFLKETPAASVFRIISWFPPFLILLQVVLGVYAILFSPVMGAGKFGTYELLAELHQLTAMFFLMSIIISLYIWRKPRPAGAESI